MCYMARGNLGTLFRADFFTSLRQIRAPVHFGGPRA
jgi:hypothetical protein